MQQTRRLIGSLLVIVAGMTCGCSLREHAEVPSSVDDGGVEHGDSGPGTDTHVTAPDAQPDVKITIFDSAPFEVHQAAPSPSSHALVPGGGTASSTSYRLVRTVGQSPGVNRVMESSQYRYVGGLVGSTQK
jgi:hypothetical protein